MFGLSKNVTKPAPDVHCDPRSAARILGWTSIAIGLCELLVPRRLERLMGISESESNTHILQLMGIREVAHGASLLGQDEDNPQMATALWGRVAGDVLDTTLLGIAATRTQRPAAFTIVSTAVAAIGLLDVFYASKLSQKHSK